MNCENPKEIINKETGEVMFVRCRKCVLCRQKRARDWAIRLINEAKYYKKMCMITLTFSPKFLLRPLWIKLTKYKRITIKHENGYIEKKQKSYKVSTLISPKYITDVRLTKWLVTRFIKKLRKHFAKQNRFISYFAAGEHGTNNTHRAHWHILIYGIDKDDLLSIENGLSLKGKKTFLSPIIMKLWVFKKLGIGKHSISEVTDRTIKYTANYTLKKMYESNKGLTNEKHSNDDKKRTDFDSVVDIYPTAFLFSNHNKIGYKWLRRNPYEICKGYLEDNDGGRYSIPEGYKRELNRYDYESELSDDCADLLEAYSLYEANMYIKMSKLDKDVLKEETRKKAQKLKNFINKMERTAEF